MDVKRITGERSPIEFNAQILQLAFHLIWFHCITFLMKLYLSDILGKSLLANTLFSE